MIESIAIDYQAYIEALTSDTSELLQVWIPSNGGHPNSYSFAIKHKGKVYEYEFSAEFEGPGNGIDRLNFHVSRTQCIDGEITVETETRIMAEEESLIEIALKRCEEFAKVNGIK